MLFLNCYIFFTNTTDVDNNREKKTVNGKCFILLLSKI